MRGDLQVTEGIHGYWFYHLSEPGKHWKSLCGKSTMQTSMPLSHWGVPFGDHFPIKPRYCRECEKLADQPLVSPR